MCSEEAEQRQLQRHTSSDGTVHWKEAFSERYRLYSNWHAGRCVVRTFQGHSQGDLLNKLFFKARLIFVEEITFIIKAIFRYILCSV